MLKLSKISLTYVVYLIRWKHSQLSSDITLNHIRAEKIKDFFILHEEGYSIYHRAYTSSKIDDDLISGFISAIFSFSKELSIERIHVMDMQESRFIYEFRAPFIYVLSVMKDVNPEFGKLILNQIMDFIETLLLQGQLEKNSLSDRLKSKQLDQKLDEFINSALLQDYFKHPVKILEEVENYLNGLFGSVGTEIIDVSIQKTCKQKANFKLDDLNEIITQIERSLERKISPSQAQMITKQIKVTFMS